MYTWDLRLGILYYGLQVRWLHDRFWWNDKRLLACRSYFVSQATECLFLLSVLDVTRLIQLIDLLLMGPSSQPSPATCWVKGWPELLTPPSARFLFYLVMKDTNANGLQKEEKKWKDSGWMWGGRERIGKGLAVSAIINDVWNVLKVRFRAQSVLWELSQNHTVYMVRQTENTDSGFA